MIWIESAMEDQEKNGLNIVRVKVVPGLRLMSASPVTSAEEAVDFITCQFKDLDREVFMVLNLAADMRVILLSNASRCLNIHNHPSGSLSPSQQDIDVTNRRARAGKRLGIEVMDSLIIGPEEHTLVSLRQEGYMNVDGMNWNELERAAESTPEQTL